eukprot:c21361_g1_i1 orf=360-3245(-)
MSKKKAFSGSTMTLRDFHGGSIPSDLPLPSAPGMVVERKNHDRPGSGGWMGSSLRGYGGERAGYSRQGSGNFARSYEEKVSYLPNPANIGRNYDEDERKPVDGHNRRGQGAEFFEEQYEQRQVGHERLPERYTSDNRGSYTSSKYADSRADRHAPEDLGSVPVGSSLRTEGFQRRPIYQQDSPIQPIVSQEHTGHSLSQAGASGPPHSPYQTQEPGQPWRQNSLGQQPVTPGTVMGTGSGVQNVWTARKEGEYSRTNPTEFGISDAATDARVQTAGSRIAHASALEKVSSGRWNSRILQPSNDSPQVYAGEYGHGGPYEGGSTYSPYNNVRSPADYDRAAYADSVKSDLPRTTYIEAGRGTDILSFRDMRTDVEKGSPHDTRREYYVEGRGVSRVEASRHADDRHPLEETGWKGNSGLRESARFAGTTEPVHTRDIKETARFGVNEAAPYVEARSSVQSNPAWIRPEPSPRRDYGDGMSLDANKGPSSDFERRGFGSRDGVVDTDYGLTHRSSSFERLKERVTPVDGSYHVPGKEDIGHVTSPYPKSRDDFSHEVPESARGGRFTDRSRGPLGPDFDQSHVGRLHSPGSARVSTHESGGTANMLSVESEVKSLPIERPKLKLLPRTKPMDVTPMEEHLQEALQEGFETPQSISVSGPEGATGPGSVTPAPTINAGSEEPTRAFERPKLSLKPRSQPVDVVPADSGNVKERKSVFGGARPRELVLKERGVDESVIVGTDITPSSAPSMSGFRTPVEGNRTSSVEKQDKLEERKLDGRRADQHEVVNVRQIGRQESGRLERIDSRGRKDHNDLEKKEERRGSEYRHHQEKRESDRPDVDKQDSWRRPAEVYTGPQSPMPVGEISSGGTGRPIQSAAELAQTFTRSTSFGSSFGGTPQGYSNQRSSPMIRSSGPGFGMGLDSPGHRKATTTDMPFSRLTEALSPASRDYRTSGVQGGYRRTSAF